MLNVKQRWIKRDKRETVRISAFTAEIATRKPSATDKMWSDFKSATHYIEAEPTLTLLDDALATLNNIAKRPDLPNPDKTADWKNCQKWSSAEAKEMAERIRKFRGEK